MKYTKQHRRSKRMNLYEISTNFCSVECNEITVTNCFLAGIIPSSESNVISYHLSEINNVEKTTDGRYFSVVFLDKKMKQRYFNLVKKIASNYIDGEIARLQFRKTSIKNSQAK